MAEITREHLELAALAAGIFWDSEAGAGIDPDKPDSYGEEIGGAGKGGRWEPHLDDGDAARPCRCGPDGCADSVACPRR